MTLNTEMSNFQGLNTKNKNEIRGKTNNNEHILTD